MKNFLLFTCLLVMSCTGCSKQDKGCKTIEPKAEEAQILAYAKADSIQVTKHSSGIYYQVIDTGSGVAPMQNSAISVTYTGKLLNGTIFDKEINPVSTNLGGVIEGWQIGIPLIKKGGHIKLLIPSAYGYGCNPYKDNNGNIIIPGNSVLYFDVTLLGVR